MKRILLGVLAALGLASLVVAQTTPIFNLIGTETLRITLGSGSGITIPINQVRNTMGVSPIGAQTTVNSSPTGTVGYLVAAGSITTWHVSLPNPAYNGQTVFLVSDGGTITTANVGTQSGTQTQTLNTAFNHTIQSGSPVGWIYNDPSSRWFRIQ